MFVLDTDHLSLIQRGGAEGLRIHSRLRACPPDDVAVSVISFEEQTRGWLARINQHADSTSQVHAYSELRRLLQSYCYVTILDFDAEAAQEFDRLRAFHRRLGTMDLKIAAIARTRNASVVTRNSRDFGRIAELRCKDWSGQVAS